MEEVARENGTEYGLAECGIAGEMGIDSLTGVLNRRAAMERVAGLLQCGGALFICDIDHFKQINDRYGHRMGDECLQQTAQTLGIMIREHDILGRCGGDEFVIFMPECPDEQTANQAAKRLTDRFAEERKKESGGIVLTVTTGCAVYEKGDTGETLFARAKRELLIRKTGMCPTEEGESREPDNYRRDAGQIREDLIEEIRMPGAYCRDYETFKSIYRFMERGIIRSGQKACVILLTAVDDEGRTLRPDEKDSQMEQLGEAIRTTLRLGDVYTRYTSSQYLMLVIDTSENFADIIADRVKEKFLKECGESSLLVHCCYELQPARYR